MLIHLFSSLAVEANELSGDYKDFSSLTKSEQVDKLRKAFNRRIELSKNIKYQIEYNSVEKNIESDKLIGTIYHKISLIFKQFQNSYIADIDSYTENMSLPFKKTIISWDANEGILKNMSYVYANDEYKTARIDTVIDPYISVNDCMALWFSAGASDEKPNPHVFAYFLSHQDSWEINCLPDNKIQLIVDYVLNSNSNSYKEYSGKWVLTLDSEKDFFPTEGKLRWDRISNAGKKHWRDESFIVKDCQFVSGIWMPTQIEETIAASSVPDSKAVTNIKVTEIEFGKLSKKDTTFVFPENTLVIDAVQGVSYRTDSNGNQIDSATKPLYGLDPSKVKMPGQKPNRTWNYVFVVFGFLMIGIGAYLHFEKRRRKA